MTGGPQQFFLPTYLGGPQVTTDNCEREPIHIPGSIQPHGAVVTVDAATHLIQQVSLNAGLHLGQLPEALLGQELSLLVSEPAVQDLVAALPTGIPDHVQYRVILELSAGRTALTAHRTADLLILEFEAAEAEHATGPQALRNAVFALESAPSLLDLADVAARAVRDLSGFDRVMIYRFAEDDSGEVIAEARRDDLHSFLGHLFPESDIPAQARALYVRHLLRLTADTQATPIPLEPVLNPQTAQPTPLGGAVLRSTSPMHLQYLRNMGVGSSLSVSIVVNGRLWGLIACHHQTAFVVPPATRTALEYLGRLLNLQVQIKHRADIELFRQHLQDRRAVIVDAATHSVAPLETLGAEALDLMGMMRASGMILFFEGRWQAQGDTPEPAQVEALLAWLRSREGTLFHTDALSEHWAPAASYLQSASGLLAISVGAGWNEGVIWLRPERSMAVAWGGATPEQAKDALGPRRSFETYVQTVQAHALPWHAGEIAEAQELHRALTAALGARLNVIRSLNAALEQSNAEWRQYAFVIAHDMQEPVRLITQFTELFHLRYRQQVDEGGERLIHFILQETARLHSLTQDLHTYTALLSAPSPVRRPVELDRLVSESLKKLESQLQSSGGTVQIAGPLPTVQADVARLRELLMHLLKNALTFGGPEPSVRIGAQRRRNAWDITVQDFGTGIAPEYHDKVFGLFQRLGHREDSAGNGIGLALCRKIAETHGGTLQLTSGPGQGTTLTFHLPDLVEDVHGA
ncbi:ATP-binding protein (plasmid) [Deinococcus sp. KNUC1210]|uniref:ATP-binding protein n=1 Tax=Deinococcus sp. KNUC1210 TaxID=2917691 RepID=UPI001EF13DF0|nr:ATP-binding protein [Deinococcus sp. KNUC1210]ULH16971.1 ATP-binding protein [Deinococcus sp. KNUC1210]